MKVIMIDQHDGEGQFPTFSMGETVHNLEACEEYAHWMSCTIRGMETFIPDIFVEDNILIRDYNPTELIVDKNENIEIEEIVYEWLYGRSTKGEQGWIPAEKVISASIKR